VPGEPVDVGQIGVVHQLDDPALHADVRIPVGLVQHGQRDARVLAQVVQPLAAVLHVHQDPVAVQHVPGGDGDRLAVRADGRDHGGVGLGEQLAQLVRER